MGLIHTAALLSRETEKALFYHPRPRSEARGSEARQVRQSNFSLSRQNGCCVNKAHAQPVRSSDWNVSLQFRVNFTTLPVSFVVKFLGAL